MLRDLGVAGFQQPVGSTTSANGRHKLYSITLRSPKCWCALGPHNRTWSGIRWTWDIQPKCGWSSSLRIGGVIRPHLLHVVILLVAVQLFSVQKADTTR